MDTRKQTLIACLRKFIAQRPGLEFGNYGSLPAYRSEMRSITKDRHHAEAMLSSVAWRDSITADSILEASRHAFSGRLAITEPTPGRFVLDYCTGQYWPTEYRRAVCSVLSSALWDYWRDCLAPDDPHKGDAIRKAAAAELSRSIARAWFH
jgi:hypothetical protein